MTRVRCMRLLCAALPNERVSSCVEHCEHDDPLCLDAKEHCVGEAMSPNAPNIAVQDWEPRGILCDRVDSTLYLRFEFHAKPDTPLLVPHGGIAKLALCRATKDDHI